jgi:hypothetical protein
LRLVRPITKINIFIKKTYWWYLEQRIRWNIITYIAWVWPVNRKITRLPLIWRVDISGVYPYKPPKPTLLIIPKKRIWWFPTSHKSWECSDPGFGVFVKVKIRWPLKEKKTGIFKGVFDINHKKISKSIKWIDKRKKNEIKIVLRRHEWWESNSQTRESRIKRCGEKHVNKSNMV